MEVIAVNPFKMFHNFIIQDHQFEINTELSRNFVVKSFPLNYEVLFNSLPHSFNENNVLLVDSNVRKKYTITHSKVIEIEATEENKSIETCLTICNKLIEFNFTKKDTLIVIGGGITQDIGAFIAKMFKRGISCEFYPTTLLSMCDSCIGGKTALNFGNYKNQLALFSAPGKVIIDTAFLDTLSQADITSGYGEIVKLFSIGGEFFLSNLNSWDIETTIRFSLEIKKLVIEKDEFESGLRKSLNYGHSFGHVIEPMTGYNIPHGEAVLLGMDLINKIFTNNVAIANAIQKYTNISKIRNLDFNRIVDNLKSDKKVHGNTIDLVVVESPGITKFIPTEINDILKKKLHAFFIN